MYRVRTNQVNVPLEGLRVFEPLASASVVPVQPQRQVDSLPSTPVGPTTAVDGEIVEESDDELPADDVLMGEEDSRVRTYDAAGNDVTSSAVKGCAVHGLLELRRGLSG
jgi:hypothetical protein